MKTRFASLLAASVLAIVSVQAAAGDWTGKAYYGPISAETLKLSDGRTLTRTVVAGYVYGDSAGNPFDMLQQTCSSTTLVASNGEEMEQFGHCDALDSKQDLFVISFHNDDWRIESGTGKFAGMKGGGKTKVIQTWPDGGYLISWAGTTVP
jgi:hypothetical protein